jgi:iron complex outermembrane receptor protein
MRNLQYIIFLSFISNILFGQATQNDSLNNIPIQEVIIHSNRISIPLKLNPGSVSLVNSDILNTMPRTISADEAFRLVPGVRIDNQANGSRIHLSIRGQGILSEHGLRGIKVLLDGIPVNDPSGFASDLYDVDWETVNQVEVLRGPAASLYGGGSNAGVLNITTQNGGAKLINATLFSSLGSNGFSKLFAQFDGTSNNIDYRMSFSHTAGDGYRQHTAFRGNQFNEKVNWKASDKFTISQIFQITGYFNQNAEGLSIDQLSNPQQANPDAIPLNEYQKTQRVTNGLVAKYEISRGQFIKLTSFIHQTSYKEPGSSDVTYRTFRTPGATLEYSIEQGAKRIKNQLNVGLDWQNQNIEEYKLPNLRVDNRNEKIGDVSETILEDTSLLANQTIQQWGLGIFLADRIELSDHLNAILSLRYDYMSNRLTDKMRISNSLSGNADFKKGTARIGFSYAFSAAFNLYANWGLGFLPPATEELTSNPVAFGGFNQNLIPATSNGEEFGLRGNSGNKLFYDFTFFALNTKNDFYRYRILPARPLETFYGNAGSSKRLGLETYIRYTPIQRLEFQLSYTWSRFRYTSPDSINGNWLPNCPQHQLYAEAQFELLKDFTAAIGTEYQSKWAIYTDKINSNIFQNGFNLFHVRLNYTFNLHGINADLSVFSKNMFAQKYIAFTEPDPDGNSYQPAAGREFFVSLRLRF